MFLAALRNSGNVRASCQAAGISRQYVYGQRVADSSFDAEWNDALVDAVDVMDAEARRRGMGGSDPLLIYMLKVHGDDRYRDANREAISVNVDNRSLVLPPGTTLAEIDERIRALKEGQS